jgi:hypothetical protein
MKFDIILVKLKALSTYQNLVPLVSNTSTDHDCKYYTVYSIMLDLKLNIRLGLFVAHNSSILTYVKCTQP